MRGKKKNPRMKENLFIYFFEEGMKEEFKLLIVPNNLKNFSLVVLVT